MARTGNGHASYERVESCIATELFGEGFSPSLENNDIGLAVLFHLLLEIELHIAVHLLGMQSFESLFLLFFFYFGVIIFETRNGPAVGLVASCVEGVREESFFQFGEIEGFGKLF